MDNKWVVYSKFINSIVSMNLLFPAQMHEFENQPVMLMWSIEGTRAEQEEILEKKKKKWFLLCNIITLKLPNIYIYNLSAFSVFRLLSIQITFASNFDNECHKFC